MGINTPKEQPAQTEVSPGANVKNLDSINAQRKIDEKDENLKLWLKVDTTDPQFTKEFAFSADGNKMTSVNSSYQIKRATREFGPAGIGWGWNVLSEEYVKGPALLVGAPEAGNFIVHTIKLELWYKFMNDGEVREGKVINYGQTKFAYIHNGLPTVDEDAPKKSLTDAIGKCLSMLGFSADIYQGMYDDNKYVNSLSQAFAEKGKQETPIQIDGADANVIRLRQCTTAAQLQEEFVKLPVEVRTSPSIAAVKEEMKEKLGIKE